MLRCHKAKVDAMIPRLNTIRKAMEVVMPEIGNLGITIKMIAEKLQAAAQADMKP
jgi:hypothetical protein